MGVTWSEFWGMNPRIIRAISEGYSEKIKSEIIRSNNMAYRQGIYFMDAIASTVGNMFSKGANNNYPKKPYEIFSEDSEENGSNEEIAVFEMKQRTKYLSNSGMSESPV